MTSYHIGQGHDGTHRILVHIMKSIKFNTVSGAHEKFIKLGILARMIDLCRILDSH